MRVRRRLFTLLETLISLSLAMLVLISLLWIYRALETMHQKERGVEKKIERDVYVQERLAELFYRLKKPIFYTEEGVSLVSDFPSLICSHAHSGSAFRQINAEAVSRLFLDRAGNLTLVTWPFPGANVEDPFFMHKEVLVENVSRLAFFFYISPKEDIVIDPEKVTTGDEKVDPYPPDHWRSDWPAHFSRLPALVVMEWEDRGGKHHLAYPLVDKEQHPTYRRREQ